MARISRNCKEKGWYDKPNSAGEDVALIHSEVSEMLEAWRVDGFRDQTDYAVKVPEDWDRQPKPEGWGSECADVLIRLLDVCYRTEVDIVYEMKRKMDYNETRPHMHGGKAL
jgi:hypothetical protein